MDQRPNAYTHREAWLGAVRDRLRPEFEAAGYPIPENVRLSCGFPGAQALGRENYRRGECWGDGASSDGMFEIFISPRVGEAVLVAGILLHELIHAAVGIDAGHRGQFAKVALKLGLLKPLTSTRIGEELEAKLQLIVEAVGPYPHAEMVVFDESSGPKKQKGRLLKASCSECDYTVRVTRKWAEVGAPVCPVEDHGPMTVEWPSEDEFTVELEGETP